MRRRPARRRAVVASSARRSRRDVNTRGDGCPSAAGAGARCWRQTARMRRSVFVVLATALLAHSGFSVGDAGRIEECRLSNVLGDHMLLQRAPVAARLWGFGKPGATVSVTTTSKSQPPISATVASNGSWSVFLQPQPASTSGSAVGVNFSFVCSTGESFSLADVLFGDVYVCGGYVRIARDMPLLVIWRAF